MNQANFQQTIACPNCGARGKGGDSLAPGQYRCPDDGCGVVTFLSEHEMYERQLAKKRAKFGLVD